ncbi:undecaprenyl-diphosphate phosphatase [Congregibacter variabilis]|uniref:Undecaprenyl-diphosphatase n=1 Tax=Congregibacter variabilis TaxID=3081200 RepID=A0ABZ0I540_9GAMM|nr:undecaprenyl-diphosphate phosphatase [Congregibacter sp. IMCC43200]
MIEWWQALVLALIQGLTEFLPISSSAHLLLPSMLLGWPDQGLAFDVAVHFGTLSAVVVYFRQDLWALTRGAWTALGDRSMNESSWEIAYLGLATIPAVFVGFALNDVMDSLRTVPVLVTTTIVFALLLGYADRRVEPRAKTRVASWQVALIIGCAQAIAPIPGTSRSGITITAGLLLGLSRHAAARFSFLLSIPIIFGAALLKVSELLVTETAVDLPLMLLGVGVAALSAYACIAVFLRLIEAVGMMPFVIYRLILGAVLGALWWT